MHKIRNFVFILIIFTVIFACFLLNTDSEKKPGKNLDTSNYQLNEADDIKNKWLVQNSETDELKLKNDTNDNLFTIQVDEKVTEDCTVEDITEESSDSTSEAALSEKEIIDSKIDEIISSMTVEEKVGQLFFIKDDGRFGAEILKDYPVGGIILFKGDFKSGNSELVKNNIEAFQNETKIPLLIGTDEEGGSVVRLSYFSGLCDQQFKSPRNVFSDGGYQAVIEDTELKSDILLDYGINVNFAPVCDYSDVPGAFMYSRSFGSSINETCTYVDKVVSTMKEKKIGSVMKHFPGYGNNGDTHTSVVKDNRPYKDFVECGFKPFIAGTKAGADCILVSHNIVEAIDPEYPASLSIKMNRVIRNEIGFDGVIITDDLMMSGVSNLYSKDAVAVRAVLAGNDMILSTDFWTQYNAVLEATKNGEISVKRLDESIRKILKWKMSIGILRI